MSLRSLHQLFHGEGLTVAGWIRQRRLERCRRDLADPALASRPVAAIAATWGYPNPADFSRAFRAVHGMPPAEYRRSARPANTSAR
jgi:AraC-like DNA-binding protein